MEDSEAVVVERGTAGRLNDGYGPESVQGDDDGEVGGNVGSDTGNGESALPLSSAEVPQAGPTSKKPFESKHLYYQNLSLSIIICAAWSSSP